MQAKLHFAFPNFEERFPLFVTLNICSMSLIRYYDIFYQSFTVFRRMHLYISEKPSRAPARCKK